MITQNTLWRLRLFIGGELINLGAKITPNVTDDNEIEAEECHVIEVMPGQKYIISLPQNTSMAAMAELKHQLSEWWSNGAPFAVVNLGDIKLVKMPEERG